MQEDEKMGSLDHFIIADYRDGRVYFGGKNYPAGIFAEYLLNQYYVSDTAARIAVFCDSVHYNIVRQLHRGYLNVSEFVKTGGNALEQLKVLPMLRPFDMIDITALKEKTAELFTEENGKKICDYFRMKSSVSSLDQNEVASGTVKVYYDEELSAVGERLVSDTTKILSFFNDLGDDMIKAHKNLCNFVSRIPEAERYDEKHLLPLALDIFGSVPFPVTSEYISILKNKASAGETVARRLYFDRYYSLILTDFFEGLHYGHYPQRCNICGKYFLMKSARKQMYCPYGIAPEEYRGKTITCRKYAAVLHRKERAQSDPISVLYEKRCAAIRSEKSRGTITAGFADVVKELALEHKLRAMNDDNYAAGQYKSDMEREKLYSDAEKLI